MHARTVSALADVQQQGPQKTYGAEAIDMAASCSARFLLSAAVAIALFVLLGSWLGGRMEQWTKAHRRRRKPATSAKMGAARAAVPAKADDQAAESAVEDENDDAVESEIIDGRGGRWWLAQEEAPLLVQQTTRAIPFSTAHATAQRPVPLERGRGVSASHLAWEYEETAAFMRRTLKADPRLRPAMVCRIHAT